MVKSSSAADHFSDEEMVKSFEPFAEEKKDDDGWGGDVGSKNTLQQSPSTRDHLIVNVTSDQEVGTQQKSRDNIPAFRCVIFCPGNCSKVRAPSSSRSHSTMNLETFADADEHEKSALGLDLLIQEHEDGVEDSWVIDHVKVSSPLVDSPLEPGDILVMVNGDTDLQTAFERVISNRAAKPVITLIVFNSNPRAELNLMETWIHPSSYRDLTGECSTQLSRASTKFGSEEAVFTDLHLKTSPQGYLEVEQIAGGQETGFWRHALLGPRDLVLSVDKTSTSQLSEEDFDRAIKRNQELESPVALRTRLQSTAGVALAQATRQRFNNHVSLHPVRKNFAYTRRVFGFVVGLAAVVFGVVLLLVALHASRHKDDDNAATTFLPSCEGDGCAQESCEGDGCGGGGGAIDGRPFRDVRGVDIVASTQTCAPQTTEHETAQLWSTIRPVPALFLQGGTTAESGVAANENDNDKKHNEWLNRALAEHASIASFAAFTISLMTNQAPPDLVRDALQAAMDEWNHATTAFAWTHHLGSLDGNVHEPSALPATKHEFGNDLTALGLATVLEGCVGETLSALDLAHQVDSSISTTESASIRTIALEEARHAALAWRTVRWVCQTDADACDTLQSQVLNARIMESMFQERFPLATSRLMDAWHQTYTQLLPFGKGEDHHHGEFDCSNKNDNSSETLSEEMMFRIIHFCWCASNRDLPMPSNDD